MPYSSRRTFLKTASLAALAGLTGKPAPAATPDPAAGSPSAAKSGPLRLSLNAFSFNDRLMDGLAGKPGGVSLYEILEFCARHDFEAIDPTGYYFPGYPEVPSREYLNEFKRRAFRLGLDISGTGIRNDFAQADPARRTADINRAKAWIEVAADLGAPVIRLFAGAVPKGFETRWDEAAAWMIEAIRECVEHGRRHGVIVGIQNHGDMLKSADECLKVMQAVGSEWCGLIVDTGNMLTADPYADIARVVPHAVNWQVKESIYNNERARPADLPRLYRIIREGGYRGYVPIETLAVRGVPYDPFQVVPAFTREVRVALAAS